MGLFRRPASADRWGIPGHFRVFTRKTQARVGFDWVCFGFVSSPANVATPKPKRRAGPFSDRSAHVVLRTRFPIRRSIGKTSPAQPAALPDVAYTAR
jgi:hypothetical protein